MKCIAPYSGEGWKLHQLFHYSMIFNEEMPLHYAAIWTILWIIQYQNM